VTVLASDPSRLWISGSGRQGERNGDTTFYALYASGTEREYAWTDAGKASASDHGVTEYEVVEARYSPQRIENEIGILLLAVAGWRTPAA
jgi:hypothetical protein